MFVQLVSCAGRQKSLGTDALLVCDGFIYLAIIGNPILTFEFGNTDQIEV